MRWLLPLSLAACSFDGAPAPSAREPPPVAELECEIRWVPPSSPDPADGFMLFDEANARMILFGGAAPALWTLTSSVWTALEAEGSWPRGRASSAAAYDSKRQQMVMFGGRFDSGEATDELWTLSLGGAVRWQQLAMEGEHPYARSGATLVYASDQDRFVLFGGRGTGADPLTDELWILSLDPEPTWTRATASSSIPARAGHAAAYDPAHFRMIVMGGGIPYENVWSLALSGGSLRWSELPDTHYPYAPSPRWAAYSPSLSAIVAEGGYLDVTGPPRWHEWGDFIATDRLPDYGAFDSARDETVIHLGGDTFRGRPGAFERAVDGAEPLELGPISLVAHDGAQHRLIRYRDDFRFLDDGYQIDSIVEVLALDDPRAEWQVLTSTTHGPAFRFVRSIGWDPEGQRAFLAGGDNYSGDPLGDAWLVATQRGVWEPLAPVPGLFPRSGFSMGFDLLRGRFLIHGGQYRPGDLWAFDPAERRFDELAANGARPPGSLRPLLVHDRRRDRLLVLGGESVWSYSFAAAEWLELKPSGGPRWAPGAAALYDEPGDRLIAFEGRAPAALPGAVWILSLADPERWQRASPMGPHPAEIAGSFFASDGERVIGFGTGRWELDLGSIACGAAP